MKNYFHIVTDFFEDNPNGDFKLPIIWNIKNISRKENAHGFIVQHMSIESSTKSIPSNNYYEAWLVEGGKISKQDKPQNWDDVWIAPYAYIEKNPCKISVTFSAKVYWIPKEVREFNHIYKWERGAITEAGNFRSIQSIDWNIEPFFVCERFYNSIRTFKQ